MSILLTDEEIHTDGGTALIAVTSMAECRKIAKAQLKKVYEAFESAGIYKIQPDGAYFWNPQSFRKFWQSLCDELV